MYLEGGEHFADINTPQPQQKPHKHSVIWSTLRTMTRVSKQQKKRSDLWCLCCFFNVPQPPSNCVKTEEVCKLLPFVGEWRICMFVLFIRMITSRSQRVRCVKRKNLLNSSNNIFFLLCIPNLYVRVLRRLRQRFCPCQRFVVVRGFPCATLPYAIYYYVRILRSTHNILLYTMALLILIIGYISVLSYVSCVCSLSFYVYLYADYRGRQRRYMASSSNVEWASLRLCQLCSHIQCNLTC